VTSVVKPSLMSKKTKLELTWIGKEHRPKLEPRILLEEADKSYHAAHRVTDRDLFDNRLIHWDNLLAPKQIKNVEAQRNDKRRSLFEAQDAIDQQREDLIGKIEGKLTQILNATPVFTIRFNLQ